MPSAKKCLDVMKGASVVVLMYRALLLCCGLLIPTALLARPLPKPADSTFWARSMGALHAQLAGECYFDTPCHVYFVEACREYGLPKASMIALDRRLRCSRIGMAGLNGTFLNEQGLMHEDLEAYRWRSALPFEAAPLSLSIDYDKLLSLDETSVASGSGSLASDFASGSASGSGSGSGSGSLASGSARRYITEDYDFAQHLLSLHLLDDLSWMLHQPGSYHPSDSLHFLRAWTEYLCQDLAPAAAHFSLVDSSSVFWEKSLFHEVALLAHLGSYEQAEARLNAYRQPDYAQLKSLQSAGLSLLRNDMPGYERAASGFDLSHSHYLQSDQLALQTIFDERQKLVGKSPLLAASLSAVIPGAGKIYAGNLSEGIMSFVITGALGALTAEHMIKQGPEDWRSITFASLTGLFYVSNIFGSYFSVQILQDHVLQKQTQAILYHIHVPLDRLFR